MASRVQQDTFMDDSDDTCPLCVEEFDLSDKNFRPCPCGYQICQFCYNNIKTTMNGLCPACRRRYDEKTIEWKVVSPEEAKADMALQAKKKLLARQKETERKQVETLSRKHLAGLRVMQKNLVYVVGLNPKSREEDLLQTLRGDQYFGQYGKIIKIVVSKAKEGANGSNSQGIYVTFAREEDAESCINAVNGSQNGDRVLRAQFGTTKYCSAYIRNETCNNRHCMFLHESGEDYNNFSRQDASKMNAKAFATQGPAQISSSPTNTAGPSHHVSQAHQSHQQDAQVVSSTSQPMARHISQDRIPSRSGSVDSSALPSSASWANKNPTESRRSSKAPSVSASSPVVSGANLPSQSIDAPSTVSESLVQPPDLNSEFNIPSSLSQRLFSENAHPLDHALKIVLSSSFKFTFDRSIYSDEDLREIDAYPPLFDENGGLVRYRMEKERERERLKQEEDERNALGTLNTADEDENPASGSLQLGGEPETQDRPSDLPGQSNIDRSAIQPPFSVSGSYNNLPFSGPSIFAHQPSNSAFNNRSLTPQQQQQLLLQRSGSTHQSPINNQYQQGFASNTSQHHHQQSNPFVNHSQNFGIPSHTRQASRYNFSSDSTSSSAAVNPNTNAQLMAQQSAMMPSNQSKIFQSQSMQQSNLHSGHFYSGVQGPPPGLKSSGTPPISGGGMFGQGHGFTTPIGGNTGIGRTAGGNKNGSEELMRELLRGRNGAMNSQGSDVGKRSSSHNHPASGDANVLTNKPNNETITDSYKFTPFVAKQGKSSTQTTTSISLGLSSNQDFPPLIPHTMADQKPQRKSIGAISSSPIIKPAVPVLPNQASRIPLHSKESHAKMVSEKSNENPDIPVATRNEIQAAGPDTTPKVKSNTSTTDTSDPRKAKIDNKTTLMAEAQTPSLTSLQSKPDSKSDLGQEEAKQSKEKQQQLGIIDTTTMKDVLKIDLDSPAVASAQSNLDDRIPNTPGISRPSTPVAIAPQNSGPSITRQVQSRTIRVLPTSKAETPPRVPPASPLTMNTVPSVINKKQHSRRGSLASIQVPGTPVSERISDNASLTSASISRASSPPPSKIGSAPVRKITKSQQKKERQARAKLVEEKMKNEEGPTNTIVEEPVQAPILGRKKKAKKASMKDTAGSTSTVTRPSPTPKGEASREQILNVPEPTTTDEKKEVGEIAHDKDGPENPTGASHSGSQDDLQKKSTPTATAVMASFQKSTNSSLTILEAFKSVPGVNYRIEITQDEMTESTTDPILSSTQIRQINDGEAIIFNNVGNRPTVILPDHSLLRGLSVEQAERYLHLRQQIISTPTSVAFHSSGREIDRYLHIAPHPAANDSASNTSGILDNRFEAPALNQTAAAASMPPYWSNTPLKGENVLRRDPPRTLEEAEQNMLEAEQAWMTSRKETEAIEKKLNTLIKKNRKLFLGSAQ